MTLPNRRVSVLQEWVMALALREQGTLLTVIRGCDDVPKYPLDSTARRLVGSLRAAIMVPADPREVDAEPGSFFVSEPPLKFKPSEFGHLPLHWFTHVMHGAEVIAYRHPDVAIAGKFLAVYAVMVSSLHLNIESCDEFDARLSEDRVANRNIVS